MTKVNVAYIYSLNRDRQQCSLSLEGISRTIIFVPWAGYKIHLQTLLYKRKSQYENQWEPWYSPNCMDVKLRELTTMRYWLRWVVALHTTAVRRVSGRCTTVFCRTDPTHHICVFKCNRKYHSQTCWQWKCGLYQKLWCWFWHTGVIKPHWNGASNGHGCAVSLNRLRYRRDNLTSDNGHLISSSHKSHNRFDKYPTMHHFVTEMCTGVQISVRIWCIVEYGTGAFWDLCISST